MTDAQQKIEALLRQYQHAANASDAERLKALYTDDGVVLPGDMPTAVGADAVRDFYAYAFSMLSIEIDIDIQSSQIVVQDDLAFATTSSTGTRLIKETNETMREDNRELWVLREISGEWKIARYMFNKSDTMR